ncbi:hypothetical protein MMC20_006308 [Loxospora ochrophaea]|nr:hypothetical protein [Loxospora ochrophaea]
MASAGIKVSNGRLYSWSDNNHGLEHKCGTCKTSLSNPRAKKTCIGIHEVPCTKYHKILFFPGASHNCAACRQSDELQYKRHREIATTVQRIQDTHESSNFSDESPVSNKKWKDPRDESLGTPKSTEATPEVQEHDWLAASTAECEADADPKRPNPQESEGHRNTDRSIKAEERSTKAKGRIRIVSAEDVARVTQVLQLLQVGVEGKSSEDGQGITDALLNNSIIAENIAFAGRLFKYGTLQAENRAKKFHDEHASPKHPSESTLFDQDGAMTLVCSNLGIRSSSLHKSKPCKALLKTLTDAIREDLTITENEARETMMRTAGYWRYVNKRTYNAMVRRNELWDWKTGEKLDEISEPDSDMSHHTDSDDSEPATSSSDEDHSGAKLMADKAHKDWINTAAAPPKPSPFVGIKDTRHIRASSRDDHSPVSSVPPRPGAICYPRPRVMTLTFTVPRKTQLQIPKQKKDDPKKVTPAQPRLLAVPRTPFRCQRRFADKLADKRADKRQLPCANRFAILAQLSASSSSEHEKGEEVEETEETD